MSHLDAVFPSGNKSTQSATARDAGPANRRATFVRWLRKTHGWFGLWGALLGLVFGFSGIWLNHRAVLKLQPAAQQRGQMQIALPAAKLDTVPAMSAWLQTALRLDNPPTSVRVEPAKAVPWSESGAEPKSEPAPQKHQSASVAQTSTTLTQPEHWTFNFGGAHMLIQADYWKGNRSVSIKTTESGFVATLVNLHKGTGMPVPWILLVDTLAGSLIFLSLSGVLLWIQTSRRRAAGLAILATSVAVTVGVAMTHM